MLIAEDKIDLMNKEHLEKFDSLKTQANNELTDLDAEKRNGEADIKKNLKILEKTTKQIGLNNAEISEHKSLETKNLKFVEDIKKFKENILSLETRTTTLEQEISYLDKEVNDKKRDFAKATIELEKVQSKMLLLLGREKRLNEYIPIVNKILEKIGKPKIL